VLSRFARKREPGRAKVRVFNPTLEGHGWQSTHDHRDRQRRHAVPRRFGDQANRHGLTLHLIGILARRRPRRHGNADRACPEGKARRESFIHVEVDWITDAARLEALAAASRAC
jgi:glutamate dehydrogenase